LRVRKIWIWFKGGPELF